MTEPIVVYLPHKLGKEEAIRRLKAGFAAAQTHFGRLLSIEEQVWTDDRLQFRVHALGQSANGFIDVGATQVRLEVVLPWLLARIAKTVQATIARGTALMLEKK